MPIWLDDKQYWLTGYLSWDKDSVNQNDYDKKKVRRDELIYWYRSGGQGDVARG